MERPDEKEKEEKKNENQVSARNNKRQTWLLWNNKKRVVTKISDNLYHDIVWDEEKKKISISFMYHKKGSQPLSNNNVF